LNRHGVRALIVGAHAVAFHAKPRFTKDFDLFAWYIGRDELVRNKTAAGRPQDLADLSWLREDP
jgi:hypothetical protein